MEVAIGNEHAETDGSSLATVDIVSDDLEVLVHKGASDIESGLGLMVTFCLWRRR